MELASQQLLTWYLKHHRKLPWRASLDPYPVWISEIMLQQTQINVVIPYYERFMKRFPTVFELAKSDLSEVLSIWSGLGYYSRARNMWNGAKYIAFDSNGLFPNNVQGLMQIPGIGRYTAGAIASISFGVKAPIVDGNVKRVMARLYGIRISIDTAANTKKFWKLSNEWVNATDNPGELNQAIMEFGELICKPIPLCPRCPISSHCKARQLNLETSIPRRSPRKPRVKLRWVAYVIKSQGKYLLENRTDTKWWKGLWNFPYEVIEKSEQAELPCPLPYQASHIESIQRLGTLKHNVTHHDFTIVPILITLKKHQKLKPYQAWFEPSDLFRLAAPSLVKKLARNLG